MINILLVKDDEVDVVNVKKAFKKNNIKNPLHRAPKGLEALIMLRGEEKSQNIPRDRRLVLLDLNMPNMNRIEFVRELRSDSNLQDIPIVVLTTSNEDKNIEAYNLNVAEYILKPVNFPISLK